jgi:hypothetical protein
MKVLVATKEGQGRRSNDFFWSDEGEYVNFPFECCNSETCGCSWSFSGIISRKATTTAKVVELDIDRAEFTRILRESHDKAYPGMDQKDLDIFANEDVERVLDIAKLFDVGAVITRGTGGMFNLEGGT